MSEPSNIESEVPGEQKLREGGSDNENSTLDPADKAQSSLQEANVGEITADDFTLEPVITVTKQESTFTKGELKLQKVTVTEDISQTSEGTKTSGAINRRLTYDIHMKIPSPTNVTTSKRDDAPTAANPTEKEIIESRRGKTKIPMARFRQAVDRVKREQKEMRKTEAVREITSSPRKSSIPRLKDSKIPHQHTTKDVKVSKEVERTPVADEDEFDKIFREINEKGSFEVSISNEECLSQVESSFDEIIHAYEEDVREKGQAVGAERVRQTRIPMLKRRSEHDIERPRNRERYTVKKSLSVDMDKNDSPTMQTEYTTETVTMEEMQGHAETSTESVTFRSETSYSNDYNIKKRQGITCDENVYNRILITDETFENAEERYRLSKYKQGGVDVDSTETVPIIDESQDLVETIDVTESYDDITSTSETLLTKISSEQVRFDKQIVSKIYKIDFTENPFELADTETTETSNGQNQEVTKEASNETITSSISKDGSISMFVDQRKTEDFLEDFKVSRYKTSSSETTGDDKDEQKVTISSTNESVRSSITSKEAVEHCELLTKVDKKHMITASGSVKNYVGNEVKDQSNTTKNNTDSIKIEASMERIDTERNIKNSVTTCSTNEIRKEETNVGKITTTDSTVKINDTEKTAIYLSAKHNYTELKDTANSDTTNRINETKKEKSTNDLVAKYSTKEIKHSTENTTHLISEHNVREVKETGKVSAKLIVREVKKETDYSANKESDSITKDITKDNKDLGNSASVLVRNVSTDVKKDTQNNETNIVMKQNIKEISSVTNYPSAKHKTEDLTDTEKSSPDITQSTKDTKATSNFISNKSEDKETKITKNFYFDRTSKSLPKISYSPVTDKSIKSAVNGTKIDDETHDAETYKIYSDVFNKMSTTHNISTQLETKTETSQIIEESSTKTSDRSKNLSVPETGSDPEDNTPILRGKVSRIISRISSIDSKTEEKEVVKDVPKKKSILSKIALFERDEPYQRIPKPRAPPPESKPLRGLAALRQTSRELRKPKIVDEIYKEYSERSAVRQGTKLQSENDEEEITIEIKDLKKEAEVNRFDSAFKTKLYDNKTSKDELLDLPKTEIFYTQKETEINQNGEEEKDQEEIVIQIKNVTNETNVPLSDSTFNSRLYEYKTFKNDTLKRAKSESYNSQKETITEEKRIEKSLAVKSSTSDLLNGINESRTKENIQVNADEKAFTTHYESSSKIINSATSSSNNISHEVSNNFKRTISSPTNLVDEIISTDTSNTFKISDRRNELDKYKGNSDRDVTLYEESKEIRSDKMVKRLRSRDPIVQRAISVVEEDLGDVIKGKVKGIISRINSLERIELTRRRIDEKNTPRGSVSERIALFEGKASTVKAEKSTEGRSWRNRTVETAPKEMDDETCMKRITELKEAKKTYGFTNASYVELRDGNKMPVIALGTALLDKRLVKQVVETAIDLGYRAIDTAFIYGNEKEVGEGINAKINDGTVKREDLYIISKLWSTFHRRDLVERACRSSLEIMGLSYFDLYLIHNPMSLKEGGDPIPKIANVLQFSEHDFMDAWYGIEDLVSKGLVRSAGLSNFNSEQVHRVTEKGRLKPVVNQVECHPYLSQDRLAGFCDAYGMKVVCFGTLGSKGTPKALKSTLPPAIEDPLVQVMAAGLGVSPAQLLVAFQVRKGRGVVAKASSASHLHENLLGQRLPLATGQLTALGALDRHKRTYTFEGMGDTHKNYPFKIAF